MTIWNFDMSAAPKGKTVLVKRKVNTAAGLVDREIEEFEHAVVLIAATDGKVYRSRWLPPNKYTPNGRWDGFSENSQSLIAWAYWPAHPGVALKLHAAAADVVAHLHLEDCGSGA